MVDIQRGPTHSQPHRHHLSRFGLPPAAEYAYRLMNGAAPSFSPQPLTPRRPGALAPASPLHRLLAGLLGIACLALLLVAASLTPDPHGLGTHQQLGLPPCGFYLVTHLPCATCGMTTAFAYAAHGHLLAAVSVQPAGATLAVLTAMTAVVASWGAVSGASLAPLGRWVFQPRVILPLAAWVLVSWGYTLLIALGIIG